MPVTLSQLILGILIPVFVICLYGLIALPKDEDHVKKILRAILLVSLLTIVVVLVVAVTMRQ